MDSSPEVQTALRRDRQRWWLWFGFGFVIVFVLMSLTISMYVPYGHGVTESKLWRYYLLTIPRVMQSSALGPNSPDAVGLLENIVVHVMCSAAGGLVFLGLGWIFGRVKGRRPRDDSNQPYRMPPR